LARYMWSSTSVNTVGSIKKPFWKKEKNYRLNHFQWIILPVNYSFLPFDLIKPRRVSCLHFGVGIPMFLFFNLYYGNFKYM
jgi:hypothetical protein